MSKRRGHRKPPKPPKHKRINGSRQGKTIDESSVDSNRAKGTNQKPKKGSLKKRGGDSGGLLTDPNRIVQDSKLIERAVRGRWGIKRKRMIVNRLVEIVQKKTVPVPTKEGIFDSEMDADNNAIAASRVLAAMNGQDQADDHLEIKLEKEQPPSTVVNVTNNVSVDSRRIELARLAQSLGATGLLIDGREVPAEQYLGTADSVPEGKESPSQAPDKAQ